MNSSDKNGNRKLGILGRIKRFFGYINNDLPSNQNSSPKNNETASSARPSQATQNEKHTTKANSEKIYSKPNGTPENRNNSNISEYEIKILFESMDSNEEIKASERTPLENMTGVSDTGRETGHGANYSNVGMQLDEQDLVRLVDRNYFVTEEAIDRAIAKTENEETKARLEKEKADRETMRMFNLLAEARKYKADKMADFIIDMVEKYRLESLMDEYGIRDILSRAFMYAHSPTPMEARESFLKEYANRKSIDFLKKNLTGFKVVFTRDGRIMAKKLTPEKSRVRELLKAVDGSQESYDNVLADMRENTFDWQSLVFDLTRITDRIEKVENEKGEELFVTSRPEDNLYREYLLSFNSDIHFSDLRTEKEANESFLRAETESDDVLSNILERVGNAVAESDPADMRMFGDMSGNEAVEALQKQWETLEAVGIARIEKEYVDKIARFAEKSAQEIDALGQRYKDEVVDLLKTIRELRQEVVDNKKASREDKKRELTRIRGEFTEKLDGLKKRFGNEITARKNERRFAEEAFNRQKSREMDDLRDELRETYTEKMKDLRKAIVESFRKKELEKRIRKKMKFKPATQSIKADRSQQNLSTASDSALQSQQMDENKDIITTPIEDRTTPNAGTKEKEINIVDDAMAVHTERFLSEYPTEKGSVIEKEVDLKTKTGATLNSSSVYDGAEFIDDSELMGFGKNTQKTNFSINIGFDWGASCSKIVYSFSVNGKEDTLSPLRFENSFICDDKENYLPSSVVASHNDLIFVCPKNKGSQIFTEKKYFKAGVIQLLEDKKQIKESTEAVYSIFNIASLLQYSLKVICSEAEKKFNNNTPDKINIRMGIPTSQYEAILQKPFCWMLEKAVCLQERYDLLFEKGLSCNTIKQFISSKTDVPSTYTIITEPEIYAEIASFVTSREIPDKSVIIVDIGSATLDFALFSIKHFNEKNVLAQYAKIEYLGIDYCVDEIKGGSREERKNALLITGKISPSVDKVSLNNVLDKIYKKSDEFIKRAITTIRAEYGLKKGDVFYYYILGGGEIARRVKDRIKSSFESAYHNNMDIFSDKFTVKEGSLPRKKNVNIPDNKLSRFQVALGLARSDKSIPFGGQTDGKTINKLIDQERIKPYHYNAFHSDLEDIDKEKYGR